MCCRTRRTRAGARRGPQPECRVSAHDTCRVLLPPTGLAQWRQPCLCPGSPRSGPQLRHEQRPGAPSGCAPALREWLDGVSDALCMLPPQLRDYRPFATTATRSRLHLPGTTGLRVRSPWPAASAPSTRAMSRATLGFSATTTMVIMGSVQSWTQSFTIC